MTPFRGSTAPSLGQASLVPRGERVGYAEPQTSALSGVNCTACVALLRGLETVSASFCPTLTCGVIRMTCLRHLVCWDYSATRCYMTCIHNADAFDASLHIRLLCCVRGQGRRLGGTGLCGGTCRRLDLLVPFPSREKERKKVYKKLPTNMEAVSSLKFNIPL